jgi:hypothetical protein
MPYTRGVPTNGEHVNIDHSADELLDFVARVQHEQPGATRVWLADRVIELATALRDEATVEAIETDGVATIGRKLGVSRQAIYDRRDVALRRRRVAQELAEQNGHGGGS